MFDKKENNVQSIGKKEKITREESFKKIAEWVDVSRSRVYGDDLKELQDMLWVAVVDERLALDKDEKRKFTYTLEEKIQKKDGSGSIEMFKIVPQQMGKVFESEDQKSTAAKTTSLIQAYCKDSGMNEIPAGFITRLDPRDSIVIQAVITAFFF